MDELRLQRALRDGPPFAASYVALPLEITDAVPPRTRRAVSRSVLLLALVALLTAATLVGVAVAGFLRSGPPGAVAYNGVLPDGTYHVFTVTEDGVEHDLFSQPAGTFDPWVLEWSPNRRQLTFQALDNGEQVVFVANADGTSTHEILRVPATSLTGCGWAPQGRVYAICTDDGLTVIDIDGPSSATISLGERPSSVEWSPDGSWLLYRTDLVLGVVRADGSGRHRLDSGGEVVHQASWAPDGSQIAFSTSAGTAGTAWVAGPDGLELRRLAVSSGVWPTPMADGFVWAPDSRGIAIQELSGPNTVDLVDLEGHATTIDLLLGASSRLESLLGWSRQAGIVAIVGDRRGRTVVTVSTFRDGSRVIGSSEGVKDRQPRLPRQPAGDTHDEIWLDSQGLHAIWQEDVSRSFGCIVRLDLLTAETQRQCVQVADVDQYMFRGGQYVWAEPE